MAEMKNAPERLDWRTIITSSDATPQYVIDALDAYFEPFAQPVHVEASSEGALQCIKCGEALTSFLGLVGTGGFTWGLVHGEGFCAGCKWPGRAHHYIKDADGNDMLTIRNVVLQYHPDFVERRATDVEAEARAEGRA